LAGLRDDVMPGYNHFSWCMCGWCYKTGVNGYSAKSTVFSLENSYAKRKLEEHTADRSWTACFIAPNATCPVCSAKVYYYENTNGSRVFFDEIGWPWPKHPCTDRARPTAGDGGGDPKPLAERKRGLVSELFEAAQQAVFDPSAAFRQKYDHSPFDLLKVVDIIRSGFDNFIKADSLSPPLEDPVFLVFTSAKFIPVVDDYFSFTGSETSFFDKEMFVSRRFKTKVVEEDKFTSIKAQKRA
jgi:hypothetical protein